jgi:hypothetical protein
MYLHYNHCHWATAYLQLSILLLSCVYKNTYYSSQNTTNFILYYVLTVHLEQLQLHYLKKNSLLCTNCTFRTITTTLFKKNIMY